MIGLVEMGGGVALLRVKITLKGSKPAIWRRVVVREDMRLDRFHNVIQIAMGRRKTAVIFQGFTSWLSKWVF